MIAAIVVGHDANSQGAIATDGASEWRWNRPLALMVQAELQSLGRAASVHYRPQFGSYTDKMRQLVAEIPREARVAVELHFNSLDTAGLTPEKLPRRTTVLHWPGSAEGERLAGHLAPEIARAIGGPSRRWTVRGQATSWSGASLDFLKLTRCPAVIVEPHFGCTSDDHQAATRARDTGRLAEGIARGIHAFLGGAA